MIYTCEAAYSGYETTPQRWWTYTLLFSALSCLLIWLFAENQSEAIAVMVNRWTLYLGKVSAYMFLIHNVVLCYLRAAVSVVFGGLLYREQIEICAAFLIGLLLTVICSHVWLKRSERKARLPRAKPI